ncbi:hypothetical protein TcG_12571 [Trypanosoma cruzi]|nr:hypothetical protein TcG_12571 [Trypanosoma cruzi]
MLRSCTSPVFHGGELSRCRGNFRRSKPNLPHLLLTQSPLLREHNMEAGTPAEHRVVARISLISGVTAAPSNLLDSDILLRLMGHVTTVAEQPSDSLVDIMAWRMGVCLPLYPTEPALPRCCCVDEDAVTEGTVVVYSR